MLNQTWPGRIVTWALCKLTFVSACVLGMFHSGSPFRQDRRLNLGMLPEDVGQIRHPVGFGILSHMI